MRAFNIPATYRPFIEAQIRLAVAEIERDIARREDEDERIQRLATISEQFMEKDAQGTVTILVGVGDSDSADIAVMTVAGATNV